MTVQRRSALLLIDVEPDARKTGGDDDGWEGCREAHAHLERLREGLAERTGAPARFAWFLRADPQIRETWGRADHVAEACPEILRAIDDHGDACGIHPHVWRWSQRLGGWFNDMGDPDWVAECLSTSIEAFRGMVGRAPDACRFGDRWLDQRAVDLMGESGIRYDLTIEPGLRDGSVGDDPHATGRLPDYRGAPRVPYRPAEGRFLEPAAGADATGALWMVPVTTTPAVWHISRRTPYLVRTSRSPNLSLDPSRLGPHLEAESARRTAAPLAVVFRAGDLAEPAYLANFLETTERWLGCAGVEGLEFTDPGTAVERWRASSRP